MSTRTKKPPKPDEPINGRDYVAKARLSDKDNVTLAEPGQTCEKVPEASLRWLVEQGRIERKPDESEGA